MTAWRVLIVEDDAPMRAFFAACVRGNTQLALAASLGSAAQAHAWLDRCDAPALDVLLVDLGLPDGSGLDVIRHACRVHPQCEPLVISMFGDEDNVLASIEAGALGYVHKDAAPEDIADTILEMKAGGSPISPLIARRVLARFQGSQGRGACGGEAPLPPTAPPLRTSRPVDHVELTQREQEVLEFIARGFSYAEIAQRRSVSVHTVQTHVKNLYGKLAVHSKNEAVFKAGRLGLLAPVEGPAP